MPEASKQPGSQPPPAPIEQRSRDTDRLDRGKDAIAAGNRKLLGTFLVLSGLTIFGAILTESLGGVFSDVIYSIGLAGLVGFATNWLAIRMLFHPRKPFLGLQGVIPRKRKSLARRAAILMEERLVSGHRLEQWLEESGAIRSATQRLKREIPAVIADDVLRGMLLDAGREFIAGALPELKEQVGSTVREVVKEKVPAFLASGVLQMVDPLLEDATNRIASQLQGQDSLNKLADKMMPKLKTALSDLMERDGVGKGLEASTRQAVGELFANLKVSDLIEQELLRQTDEEIERMADDVAAEQLVFLQIAGGVLGALMGLALIWPILLVVYAVPAAILIFAARRRDLAAARSGE